METYLDISRALLTPLIALIAVGIARQQLVTNRNKFRLDLFDKRYEAFAATSALRTTFFRQGKIDWPDVHEFRHNTANIVFFFGQDLIDFIKKIDSYAVVMVSMDSEFNRQARDEVKNENRRKKNEAQTEFIQALKNLESKFHPYLGFEEKSVKTKSVINRNWRSGSIKTTKNP